MDTPILDFVQRYAASGTARLHMPGHKGASFLGCEALDLTEIAGADALYEADGIIAGSEENAAALFGTARTLFSTEGSSQCIKAMLYLALTCRPKGAAPVIVAARNVHKAFVHAAALLDFEIVWLWPEESRSLCTCPITAQALEKTLSALPSPPAAVYVTSPDYLGNMQDIAALSEVAHRYGTILAVDNAHGAYLRFLPQSLHPMDLGADLCCDSAHKTLPVLTGGAYLHISPTAPAAFRESAKTAMALFGSTSPSYLTLASLDGCNRYLAEEYPPRLAATVERLDALRAAIQEKGWQVEKSDPLRITLTAPADLTGHALAQRLRSGGVECEYADPESLVLMATPENREEDFRRLALALGENHAPTAAVRLPLARGERILSCREALFTSHETIPTALARGRICAAPTVGCPPAIPVVVSGERIGEEALQVFAHYGIPFVDVVKE